MESVAVECLDRAGELFSHYGGEALPRPGAGEEADSPGVTHRDNFAWSVTPVNRFIESGRASSQAVTAAAREIPMAV